MDQRNEFPGDEGINPQRRHRRRAQSEDRTGIFRRPSAPETEEKVDFRRPAQTETAEREAPAGGESPAEAKEQKVDFRRPAPAEAEKPEPEAEAEPVAAEPERTAPGGEDTRRLSLSETDGNVNGEPAAESRQRADSRVPEEARRMAAAPYGTGRPEHRRPGTRPQVAPPRPERPAAAGSERYADRQNGRALAKELRRQAAVGYAPGRMNEGFTRQIPARTDLRDQAPNNGQERVGNRDARAYLERRGQPFRGETAREPAARPASRGLKMLVVALLLVGAVLAALAALKGRGGDPAREVNQVISFEESKPEGIAVCTDVTYSVLTSKAVNDIRLTDESGRAVPASVVQANNADGKAWMITLTMEENFEGVLQLEIQGEDGTWMPTEEKSSRLSVIGASSAALPTGDPQEEARDEAQKEASQNPETPVEETAIPPEETDDQGEEPLPEEAEPAVTSGTEADAEASDEEEEEPEEEAYDEEEGEGEDTGMEAGFREVGELRTAVPTATPAPEEVEKPTETPPLAVEADPEANPDLITNVTVYSGRRKQKDYHRPAKELIHMPEASRYALEKIGVPTFRGDNFRRNAAVGKLEAEPTGLQIKWEVEGGSVRGANQTYYGYGWPGQPAIAKWSKQVRQASNLYETKQEKELLKEVIIAGQDGNIRFLDLDDGSITRNSIKLGYPMNGTPSLHTVGQPYMSVGQFARKMKVKTGRIGLRTYNLYNQKELTLIDGLDAKHRRPLNNTGSFETSALYDRISDTMITAGSNGMLYLEALNSEFDWKVGVMKVSLSETAMTSKVKGQKNTALSAVESSLAAYDKYVFYADMGGVLRCVDTDTLQPVWAKATGDAVMAAVALDLTEERELNLYTANMYANRKKGNGEIQIRRIDALSGREAWCTDIGVYKGKKDKDGVGAKASPVIGEGGLKDLVYYTVTGLSEDGCQQLRLSGEKKSALIALRKDTGKIVWSMGMDSRTESSPVAVYDKEENGWIIQCAQDGTIYLVEGLSGKTIGSLKLEAEIIASPAVYNETMVIGTTGKGTSFIYGIEIRTADLAGEEEDVPEETDAEESSREMQEEEPAEADEEGGEDWAAEDVDGEWAEEEGWEDNE